MDAIIFDVDGTLWDSTQVVAGAYNQALREHTVLPANITPDILKTLFGKPMDEIFQILTPSLPLDQREHLAELCFQKEHAALKKTPGNLYPHWKETLEALSKHFPLYIVSNCQSGYIELFLEKTGFGSYFQGHLCFGQTQTSKGQTILRLMREHHILDPVYVGDTQGDANACKEAGIPFVFASYGFGTVPDPDFQISDPLDLIKLFV